MKTFAQYDFNIQLFFLIAGIMAAIIGCSGGLGIMLFYGIAGIPQLISFLIKAFQKEKKSLGYIVYGIFIMPIWISVLIVLTYSNDNTITNFFGYVLIVSLIYSPFMAVLYVYDNYRLYKSYK
ncbi:hypothetical protein [Chryseobacterium lathyri]|uniref:Lipoprotein n=1 Tax=Chryseobacterium lathyri TaxID=395933 RepID=A0ABT9SRJ3_9FLAO|nr:hypothetical protein [Chryseobacterium lathyri]MDP9962047.1 hypothetical protein [Chryseobacterium lathyri]